MSLSCHTNPISSANVSKHSSGSLIKILQLLNLPTRSTGISYGQIDNSWIVSCVSVRNWRVRWKVFRKFDPLAKSWEDGWEADANATNPSHAKVSNSVFFILFHPDWDAMKSVFIANLSTPQERMGLQDDDTAHGSSVINHPIAPIQFKSENNTSDSPFGDFCFVSNIRIMIHFYGEKRRKQRINFIIGRGERFGRKVRIFM